MSWAPHGQWRIRVLDQVMIYEATGAWNEQGTTLFRKATRAAAVEVVGAPWALFGCLLDWDLATPASIDLIRQATEEAVANGCIFECMLFRGDDLMRYCIDRMAPGTLPNFDLAVAHSLSGALEALSHYGFSTAAQVIKRRGFEAVISEGVTEHLHA